jgi:hypothetical protein
MVLHERDVVEHQDFDERVGRTGRHPAVRINLGSVQDQLFRPLWESVKH